MALKAKIFNLKLLVENNEDSEHFTCHIHLSIVVNWLRGIVILAFSWAKTSVRQI